MHDALVNVLQAPRLSARVSMQTSLRVTAATVIRSLRRSRLRRCPGIRDRRPRRSYRSSTMRAPTGSQSVWWNCGACRCSQATEVRRDRKDLADRVRPARSIYVAAAGRRMSRAATPVPFGSHDARRLV